MLSRMRAISLWAAAIIAAVTFIAGPAPARSSAATLSGNAKGATVPAGRML